MSHFEKPRFRGFFLQFYFFDHTIPVLTIGENNGRANAVVVTNPLGYWSGHDPDLVPSGYQSSDGTDEKCRKQGLDRIFISHSIGSAVCFFANHTNQIVMEQTAYSAYPIDHLQVLLRVEYSIIHTVIQ